MTFVVYLGLQWWAFWYPGAEPGGGGYIAQRIFSAKDERHGLLSVLWFNIAHYAMRPWPWILTALAAVVLYPQPGAPGDRLYAGRTASTFRTLCAELSSPDLWRRSCPRSRRN